MPPEAGPAHRFAVKLHRKVCLVQVDDPMLAEEMLARKKLAPEIAGRLNGHVLLIRPGRVDTVVAELQAMGQTPRVLGKPATNE